MEQLQSLLQKSQEENNVLKTTIAELNAHLVAAKEEMQQAKSEENDRKQVVLNQ